jgi:hypothetical protein
VLETAILGVALGFMPRHDEAAGGSTDAAPKVLGQRADRLPDTADHVWITAVDRGNGHDDSATIVVVIEPGYHINANPASMENLIPTMLNITDRWRCA